MCEDSDAFVPLRSAWAFFDSSAESVDPFLGWHVGKFIGDKNLNHGFLRKVEHAPTLLQALRLFIRMSFSEASHLTLGIRERRSDIIIFTHYTKLKTMPGYTISQAYQVGVIVDLIRHFAGANWMPGEIGIEHPVVPASAQAIFPDSRILACQPAGYISIPRSHLHLAPPRRDSEESGKVPMCVADRLS